MQVINCHIFAIIHLFSAGLSRAHAPGIGEGRRPTIASIIVVLSEYEGGNRSAENSSLSSPFLKKRQLIETSSFWRELVRTSGIPLLGSEMRLALGAGRNEGSA